MRRRLPPAALRRPSSELRSRQSRRSFGDAAEAFAADVKAGRAHVGATVALLSSTNLDCAPSLARSSSYGTSKSSALKNEPGPPAPPFALCRLRTPAERQTAQEERARLPPAKDPDLVKRNRILDSQPVLLKYTVDS